MENIIEIWSLVYYVVVQGAGLIVAATAAIIFLYIVLRNNYPLRKTLLFGSFFVGVMLFFWFPVGLPESVSYPLGLRTYGPAAGPGLPLKNVPAFFMNLDNFERVSDIARDPRDVPPPIERTEPAEVSIEMTAKEVLSDISPGVTLNYWTFDGQVPGPFLRVREGDTVHLTLKNDESSLHHHSIDLHAVTGPGGGASVTNVKPGEEKTFSFKAMKPGLYVYHCAHPNVANHMAHGMYGLILVEPEEGLPSVDEELYVMQGEFYTAGKRGVRGLQIIDGGKMLAGDPSYVVFNGRTEAISADDISIAQDETVRMYVGNGGVNLTSSFHMIGEIFDTVYPEAQMGGDNFKNVQTTTVPAGGATIAEFVPEVPGTYILVDHALARMDKGAWGTIGVTGEDRPDIFIGGEDRNTDHAH